MNFSTYNSTNNEEIRQLFIKTFSDSEGESEGSVIGNLVHDLMTTTDENDLYGFVTVEDEKIIGSIFLFIVMAFHTRSDQFLGTRNCLLHIQIGSITVEESVRCSLSAPPRKHVAICHNSKL